MITIDSLSLKLNPEQSPILEDINWKIGNGERWILFGRNGCGKTKLLEVITGYRRPSSGNISRFGHPSLGYDIRSVRKKIGYLSSPLREKIHPKERAVDLVVSGFFATAGLYDNTDKELFARAEVLLEGASLLHRKDDLFSHFSEGEKQKLLLARALINKPELLILDEPCSGLDIAAREELLATLETLISEEKTHNTAIIYVTHHIEEITPLFQSVLMLKKGKEFCRGRVEEVITEENLSQLFGLKVTVYTSHGRFHTVLEHQGITQ